MSDRRDRRSGENSQNVDLLSLATDLDGRLGARELDVFDRDGVGSLASSALVGVVCSAEMVSVLLRAERTIESELTLLDHNTILASIGDL